MMLAAVETVTKADPVWGAGRHKADLAAQATAGQSVHAMFPPNLAPGMFLINSRTPQSYGLMHQLQGITEHRDDVLDMGFLSYQRRREGYDVAGDADQQAPFEAIDEDIVSARTGRAVAGG